MFLVKLDEGEEEVMNYQDIILELEGKRQRLLKDIHNISNNQEKVERIQMELDNIEYVIELVEMNHFSRGLNH